MSKHVSIKERERVQADVLEKLTILQSWASRGIPWQRTENGDFVCNEKGHRLLEYFPADIKAFAGWNGSQASTASLRATLGSLKTCSRDTLGKAYHEALRVTIDNTLEQLSAKAASQLALENKGDVIAALKAKNKQLQLLCSAQEKDILSLRRTSNALKQELAGVVATLASNNKLAAEEVADLRIALADLTRAMQPVARLRLVKE